MDTLVASGSDSATPNASKKPEYLLGIDLGVLSLGWAAVKLQEGQPAGLLDVGVRAWEWQNIPETDIAEGKEEPPSQARRQMRQIRRQLFRRAQRLRRTWRALQQLGLFPPGSRNAAARKAFLDQLDGQAKVWLGQHRFTQADPPPPSGGYLDLSSSGSGFGSALAPRASGPSVFPSGPAPRLPVHHQDHRRQRSKRWRRQEK